MMEERIGEIRKLGNWWEKMKEKRKGLKVKKKKERK